LGRVALDRGEIELAQEFFLQVEISEYLRRTSTAMNMIPSEQYALLEAFAYLAASSQQLIRAVQLFGTTEAWHQENQYYRTCRERRDRANYLAKLRNALPQEAFADAWEQGRAMTFEEAKTYARQIQAGDSL
jgi:hypothetical protein